MALFGQGIPMGIPLIPDLRNSCSGNSTFLLQSETHPPPLGVFEQQNVPSSRSDFIERRAENISRLASYHFAHFIYRRSTVAAVVALPLLDKSQ